MFWLRNKKNSVTHSYLGDLIQTIILYIQKFSGGFYFRETLHNKNKTLLNGKITSSFTDVGKTCPSRELLTSQLPVCLLTFPENKILVKNF